jgi:phage shock protein A
LAYLWARSYAIRANAPDDAEYDVEAIERVINNLEREFSTLKQLKDAHTPIRKNIEKAQLFVEEFEEQIDEMLEELRTLITPSDKDE